MAKQDRQAKRLEHMSGGGQLGGTHYGQTAGTTLGKKGQSGGSRRPR
jgi:hypothetical protein